MSSLTAAPRASLTAPVAWVFHEFADGGAQRLARTTWKHLDRRRWDPRLFCLGSAGALVERVRGELPVEILGRLRRPWDLGAVGALATRLRRLRPRIVEVQLYSRASPYARLAARLAGVPLVIAHEYGRGEPPRRARRLADRLLRGHTRFVACSEFHRRELLAQGIPDGAIAVRYDGIELERFPPAALAETAPARRALGLPAERRLALVPARLHPMKGHHDLLAALPAVVREAPDLLVLCAGGGPLAPELEREIAARGLGEHVRLLGQREDIPALLAAVDLVVLPSRREGVPAALLEAFAAARAVVATAVGGVPELLVDGEQGLLVPPAQPAALTRAIGDLLAAPARRAAMGARGHATARERADAAAATRELEGLYDRWLSESIPERALAR